MRIIQISERESQTEDNKEKLQVNNGWKGTWKGVFQTEIIHSEFGRINIKDPHIPEFLNVREEKEINRHMNLHQD